MNSRVMRVCALALFTAANFCHAEADVAIETPGRVESLPAAPGAHWIWVSDMVWTAMTDGRATLIDAGSGQVLGMLSTGYSFNTLTLPRSPGIIYAAETYYSRYTRGERTDVVTAYDGQTLAPLFEVKIPPKRMSTTPKLSTTALTDDDRFLLVYNFTPAQSFSLVDVQARKFVGEVPAGGCALVYPVGERSFLSLCPTGAVRLVRLDDNGALRNARVSDAFFDPQNDPLLEKGVRQEDGVWLFPSYESDIYRVAVGQGDAIDGRRAWSLLDDADKQASWRIGGIQPLAIGVAANRLYALMHQGGPDTHHQPGEEVWMFDLTTRKRLARFVLKHPATSIQVSQDDRPLLYAVRPDATELIVYDAQTGQHLRTVREVSITPSLLQLPR